MTTTENPTYAETMRAWEGTAPSPRHRQMFVRDHHSRTCPNRDLGSPLPRALYCHAHCLSYVPRHAVTTSNPYN
jgi:hypothetical protein